MSLNQIIIKKNKTVYQQVADEFGVTVDYVGKIARSQRTPKRQKGLQIKEKLEELALQ